MQQIFESESISFFRVSTDLVNDYLIMVNDEQNVSRFIGGSNRKYSKEQEICWVQKKLEENAPVFSMLEKKTGAFIGNIEFMDMKDAKAELGIAITAEMQNKGFGTEAVSAFTKYGRQCLGLQHIVLRARPFNLRALHVYEKCGFREYNRTEDHVYMELI